MKYLLLIYGNPAEWNHPMFLYQEGVSEAAREEMTGQFEALLKEISESGELIEAAPLTAPAEAKVVRHRNEALSVTDGPFAETKEQLAGYFLVDCATPERAQEIAGRFPDVRFGAVEVRSFWSG
jgi:hypothetical protein